MQVSSGLAVREDVMEEFPPWDCGMFSRRFAVGSLMAGQQQGLLARLAVVCGSGLGDAPLTSDFLGHEVAVFDLAVGRRKGNVPARCDFAERVELLKLRQRLVVVGWVANAS